MSYTLNGFERPATYVGINRYLKDDAKGRASLRGYLEDHWSL